MAIKIYDIKALRAEFEKKKKKKEKELIKYHLLIRWENKDGSEYSEISDYDTIDDLTDDLRQSKMNPFIEHYRKYPSPILICVYCDNTPLYMSTIYGSMTIGEIIAQIMDTVKNVLNYSEGL